jgi:hypothetical protein
MNTEARISRILLVSPEDNETIRRNRSRVFVWPKGEAAIDAMIFQSQRPIDSYRELAIRAIMMSGLKIQNQDHVELDIVEVPTTTGMQQHFSTRGWCRNDEGEVFDIIIEAALLNEELPSVSVSTIDPIMDGIESGENPLIIEAQVSNLKPRASDDKSNVVPMTRSTQSSPKARVARKPTVHDGHEDENPSGRMKGRPGRVKNHWDGRLAQNRTHAMA